MAVHQIFELGDFQLQKGSVLPDAKLGYLTLGELNEARDNVVVSPTWFTAQPADVAFWLTGPGRALDPSKYFIVIPNHFGAAVSSSPSNTPPPFERTRFPRTTAYDNVVAQQRLLTEALGVERIKLVAGWSMGACQSYAWAALFPDMVEALGPINGSARTANFNKVFLRGNIRAIQNDAAWAEGFYDRPPIAGIKAMAAIYAGWAFSEPFYRKELFRVFGATSTGRLHRELLGRLLPEERRERPALAVRHLVPQRPRRSPGLRRRLRRGSGGDHRAGRSSSRPRPTATSRPPTPTTRRRRSRTPVCSGSTPTGATWRRSTPTTRS